VDSRCPGMDWSPPPWRAGRRHALALPARRLADVPPRPPEAVLRGAGPLRCLLHRAVLGRHGPCAVPLPVPDRHRRRLRISGRGRHAGRVHAQEATGPAPGDADHPVVRRRRLLRGHHRPVRRRLPHRHEADQRHRASLHADPQPSCGRAWRCSDWVCSPAARRCWCWCSSAPMRSSSAAPRCCSSSTRTSCSPPISSRSPSAPEPRSRASGRRSARGWCRCRCSPSASATRCAPARARAPPGGLAAAGPGGDVHPRAVLRLRGAPADAREGRPPGAGRRRERGGGEHRQDGDGDSIHGSQLHRCLACEHRQ